VHFAVLVAPVATEHEPLNARVFVATTASAWRHISTRRNYSWP